MGGGQSPDLQVLNMAVDLGRPLLEAGDGVLGSQQAAIAHFLLGRAQEGEGQVNSTVTPALSTPPGHFHSTHGF